MGPVRFDDDERGLSSRADVVDNRTEGWNSRKPQPSLARSSTVWSGYRDSGSTPDPWARGVSSSGVQEERRPLVLDPPGKSVRETPAAAKTSKPSPFGEGRPREQVLAERRSDCNKSDSNIEAKKGSSQTSIPSSAQSNRSESFALNSVVNRRPSGDAEPEQHRPVSEGDRTLKEDKEAPIPPEAAFRKAAANLNPLHLTDFLVQDPKGFSGVPRLMLATFVDYFENEFSGVSFLWDDIFKEPVWSSLFDVVDVSHIPKSVYTESAEWINQKLPYDVVRGFLLWSFSYIMKTMFFPQGGKRTKKSNVSIFVALAMVLRAKPHVLAMALPALRKKQIHYQRKGAVTCPLTVWMIAQASHDNLYAGLYSWAHNLLPLLQQVGINAQSKDLILQFVEKILEKPDAGTELVKHPVLHGDRLVPPPSFEILLRLTFPATSARKEITTRFEKIYPLLKKVALAGAPESEAVMEQIFTFSLTLAGEAIRNPVLAKEATSIAIWSLTKNDVCWKRWDYLYNEDPEASVALLKKLVERMDHPLELSPSSPSDTLTLSQTMKSFRIKNKKAVTEGGAKASLYKEADQSCKVISTRLSRGSSSLKGTCITAVVLVAVAAAPVYLKVFCFYK